MIRGGQINLRRPSPKCFSSHIIVLCLLKVLRIFRIFHCWLWGCDSRVVILHLWHLNKSLIRIDSFLGCVFLESCFKNSREAPSTTVAMEVHCHNWNYIVTSQMRQFSENHFTCGNPIPFMVAYDSISTVYSHK